MLDSNFSSANWSLELPTTTSKLLELDLGKAVKFLIFDSSSLKVSPNSNNIKKGVYFVTALYQNNQDSQTYQ